MNSIGLVDYIKQYFNFWAIIFKGNLGKSNFLLDLIIQIPGKMGLILKLFVCYLAPLGLEP